MFLRSMIFAAGICRYQQENSEGGDTGGGVPGAPDSTPGEAGKTFTEAEVNAIVVARLARERAKNSGGQPANSDPEKQALFEILGIGGEGQPKTVSEFLELQKRTEEKGQAEKGKYKELWEKTKAQLELQNQLLNETKAQYTARISQRETERALLAECGNAIQPSQVAALLRSRVRYNAETDEVEVMEIDGKTQAVDVKGNPLSVKDLVSVFLRENPHFLPASKSAGGGTNQTPTGAAPQGQRTMVVKTNQRYAIGQNGEKILVE